MKPPAASCNNKGCDWKTNADGTWKGTKRLGEMHLEGAHGTEGSVKFSGTTKPVNPAHAPKDREWDQSHYSLYVGRTNSPP